MSAPHAVSRPESQPQAIRSLAGWPPPTRNEPSQATSAPTAPQEAERLSALHALDLLDTPPEPEFDDMVQLAAAICETPVGTITLVDERRQWFKASLGLGSVTQTPREASFCSHAIQQPGLMIVEDAMLDQRFNAEPTAMGAYGIRFYAGMPLKAPDGHLVGALCVMDRVPRSLSPHQKASLRVLANQINTRLELRTQRLELQRALEEAQKARERAESLEHRFQTFMDSGPFLAYMKDAEGRLVYYNQGLARQFNVSRQALLNKTDTELWPAELAIIYRQHDLEVLHTGSLQINLEETSNPDGSTSIWRSYKFPCTEDGGHCLLGGVSVDVTEELRRERELQRYQAELEEANLRLRDLASLDALTALPNRRCFDDQLRQVFRQARSTNTPLSILMLDVDRFKRHNDQFGHAHGDDVLRTLAQHLKAKLRVGDFVARFGGEEFVILLPDTDEEGAERLGQRLVRSVRNLDWSVAPVTISVGASTLKPATSDARRLLSLADEALYAAKCTGRDRLVCYRDIFEQTLASARRNAQALPQDKPSGK